MNLMEEILLMEGFSVKTNHLMLNNLKNTAVLELIFVNI